MARARIVLRLVVGCAVALASSALPAATHPDTVALQQASAPVLAADNVQRLREEIKAAEEILPRLVDRAAALYLLAHHYARLGEHAKALSLLKQSVALNEEFDPARVKAFAPLQSDPEFRDLVERARRKNPPVHRARVAFTVAQTDLFPEGLAVDAPKRVFYMGSEYHNKIVTISEGR
jgi:tetratricopeptide (TPR) repeat protein